MNNNIYYQCAEGWFPIIDLTIKLCEKYCEENGLSIKFKQIKEKFGVLRIYYVVTNNNDDNGYAMNTDYIMGVIKMAEALSTITCEFTGCPGKLYKKKGKEFGWWKTLCLEKAREFGYTE